MFLPLKCEKKMTFWQNIKMKIKHTTKTLMITISKMLTINKGQLGAVNLVWQGLITGFPLPPKHLCSISNI